MAIEVFAPAKINLTLHVTGQRDDGYHLLDSLVVFTDVGDRLWLTPGDDMRLAVSGPFAEGVPYDESNLVWRAAEFAQWTGLIQLEKNLPHGAGIGGGSADAAAVLRVLSNDHNPAQILQLGVDVPVCLSSVAQRMSGIGEALTPVCGLPELNMVLVNPQIHIPTPQVFKALSCRENLPMTGCGPWRDGPAFVEWLQGQRNDLQETACQIASEVGAALMALEGAQLARMSGSGSTCFGIYSSSEEAQNAAADIANIYPDWWICATSTVGRPTF